jgi:hypothetical protein
VEVAARWSEFGVDVKLVNPSAKNEDEREQSFGSTVKVDGANIKITELPGFITPANIRHMAVTKNYFSSRVGIELIDGKKLYLSGLDVTKFAQWRQAYLASYQQAISV